MNEYAMLVYRTRNRLKSELVTSPSRVMFTTDGYKPRCAWCGQPVMYMAPDMHEVFITRGDMMSHNIDPALVFIGCNCALVHPGPCHQMAATKEGQRRCWEYLIKAEGGHQILTWLIAMSALWKSSVITEAINNLTRTLEELNEPNPA